MDNWLPVRVASLEHVALTLSFSTGTYETTVREIFRGERFDMGYWVGAS